MIVLMRTWMLPWLIPAALVATVVIGAIIGTGVAGAVVLLVLFFVVLVGCSVVYSAQTRGRSKQEREMPVGRLDELLKRRVSDRRGS